MYDITKFLEEHPAGPEILLEFAGKDADDMFEDIGHSSVARSIMEKFLIGYVHVSDFLICKSIPSIIYILHRLLLTEGEYNRKFRTRKFRTRSNSKM